MSSHRTHEARFCLSNRSRVSQLVEASPESSDLCDAGGANSADDGLSAAGSPMVASRFAH